MDGGREKTVKKIIAVFALALAVLVAASPVHAQQKEKVWRIGFLTTGSPVRTFKIRMAAFREGLKKLGYVEGKNVIIEERYAKGRKKRLLALASELIRLKVDIFVTHSSAPAWAVERALKKAGRTIPIVFAVSGAPVEEGLVASLARPGGNITGLSDSHSDLGPKRLEFLKEIVPSARRIAVLWNPNARSNLVKLKALQALAPGLDLTIVPLKFGNREDLDLAFASMRMERPDALNVLGHALLPGNRRRIADFALKNRLPAISGGERSAMAGLLITYGTSLPDMYRRSATYVDKIFKGAKPADLPVEQPTKFYLTINLKTAKALGITIPPEVLFQATKVIR
jgi:putative ABC transport system substrate-binding protein